MTAFSNLSFEEPDPSDDGASPLGWTFDRHDTAIEVAAYAVSGGNDLSVEGFDLEWNNTDALFVFADDDIEAAAYVSGDVENFESGWSDNEHFLTAMGSTTAAVYTPSHAYEYFDTHWSNNSFQYAFIGIGTDLAAWSLADLGGTPETFEGGNSWNGGGAYVTSWPADAFAVYQRGAGSGAAENFEEVHLGVAFTVDPATDVFTSTGHGLSNGYPVVVRRTPTTVDWPQGLNPAALYFVVAATTDTFQLSATSGGAAVDVTTAGLGLIKAYRYPVKYWIDFMLTI